MTKAYRITPKILKLLSLTVFTTGCLFASSSNATFYAESHACGADSRHGTPRIGHNRFRNSRSASTHQVNETFNHKLRLTAELWAYPENGNDPVVVVRRVYSLPGVSRNRVIAKHTDARTAPGSLVSVAYAWTPTMSRWSGTFIAPDEPIGRYGCRDKLVPF